MIICTNTRSTSQGQAFCHQREQHHGDHIAIIEDLDGQLWIVGWSDRYPGHTDITPITNGIPGLAHIQEGIPA